MVVQCRLCNKAVHGAADVCTGDCDDRRLSAQKRYAARTKLFIAVLVFRTFVIFMGVISALIGSHGVISTWINSHFNNDDIDD